jgi:opacity protein-like surface antigen
MRLRSILAVLAIPASIAILAPASVMAEASDYYVDHGTFALGGGFNQPAGSTTQYLNSSGSFFFAAGRNLGSRFALQGEFTHNWLTLDPDVLARASSDSVQITGSSARMWSVTLNAVFRFKGRTGMIPWVTGGAGYYKRSIELTTNTQTYLPPVWDPWWGWIDGGWVPGETIVGERTDAGTGFNLGAGLDFPLDHGTLLFIDVRYHHAILDGKDMEIIPIMAGLRF